MSQKGHTLWEMWTGNVPPPPIPKPEDNLANHLHLHVGDYMQVRVFGEGTPTYAVTEVCEYTRHIGDERFKFSDYVLRDGDEMRILRVNPREGTVECDLLLLTLKWQGDFDSSIGDAVRSQELNTPWGEKYFMLNAGADGFSATVHSVAQEQTPSISSGQTQQFKPQRRSLRYWDFFRKGNPEQNPVETAEEDLFLFAEFDDPGGYIRMLEGKVVSPRDISHIPAGSTV